MSIKNIVSEILGNPAGNVEKLMGDIIRVLGLSIGRLWLYEIKLEIEALRSSLNRSEDFNDEMLKEAIQRLQSMGIVKTEPGLRATFRESEPDLLVDLTDRHTASIALLQDNDYVKYHKMMRNYL